MWSAKIPVKYMKNMSVRSMRENRHKKCWTPVRQRKEGDTAQDRYKREKKNLRLVNLLR